MKAKFIITIILISFFISANSQIKKDTIKPKSNSSFNMIDAQLDVFKMLAGDEKIDGIDFKNVKNYKDLLDKLAIDPQQKKEMTNLYYLQKNEINQKTKDSLGKAIEKKIVEAQKNN